MPQHLLLEGPDLEALMVRAREEYGADCRIVRAEKIRTGGVLGFFQKERFELTIEVSDAHLSQQAAVPPAPNASQASAPVSDFSSALEEEIADAMAAREAMLSGALGSQVEAPIPTAAPSQPAPTSAPIANQSEFPASDAESFDDLVMRLAEQAGTERNERNFQPVVFPSVDRTPPTPRDGGTTEPGDQVMSQGTVVDTITEVVPSPSTPAEPRDVGATQADGVVLHKWGVFTDVATAVSTSCTVPALLALGVPRRYLSRFDTLDAPIPLLEVVASFGVPAVRRPEPGDVVVIAGPADQAVAVASQVAAWMSVPSTAVVLAGNIDPIRGHGRRLRTVEEASTARRKADKVAAYGEPLIVALGVAPGVRGAQSAAPMLKALDADVAWAVVDATKRAAIQEQSLAQLQAKARIDGLAAIGTAEAQAPGALLDASLPIAWMDGLPAASVVWAALLGERIAETA